MLGTAPCIYYTLASASTPHFAVVLALRLVGCRCVRRNAAAPSQGRRGPRFRVFLRGMPSRWRRSQRLLRLIPSFSASSVSVR